MPFLTGHRLCRGQRAGRDRGAATRPAALPREPSLLRRGAAGDRPRGGDGQDPGGVATRTLERAAPALRRSTTRRAGSGHRVGELPGSLQPRVRGAAGRLLRRRLLSFSRDVKGRNLKMSMPEVLVTGGTGV